MNGRQTTWLVGLNQCAHFPSSLPLHRGARTSNNSKRIAVSFEPAAIIAGVWPFMRKEGAAWGRGGEEENRNNIRYEVSLSLGLRRFFIKSKKQYKKEITKAAQHTTRLSIRYQHSV